MTEVPLSGTFYLRVGNAYRARAIRLNRAHPQKGKLMTLRFWILVAGVALVDTGTFIIYRPASLIVTGALFIALAARGGK